MDKDKQRALEAAGFRSGYAKDFLQLSEIESALVELRLKVSRSVRELREKLQLTQQQLAAILKSSQSRVAKIESAANDVSLDLLVRSLFAMGGKVSIQADADPGATPLIMVGKRQVPTSKRTTATPRNRLHPTAR